MRILKTEHKLCLCCMEEHDVQTIEVIEKNLFKGIPVEYPAIYTYCDRADELYANEPQISANYISMKNRFSQSSHLYSQSAR